MCIWLLSILLKILWLKNEKVHKYRYTYSTLSFKNNYKNMLEYTYPVQSNKSKNYMVVWYTTVHNSSGILANDLSSIEREKSLLWLIICRH